MAGPLGVVPPAAMDPFIDMILGRLSMTGPFGDVRSEEHTSELQSLGESRMPSSA